jgi:hypothetical protein
MNINIIADEFVKFMKALSGYSRLKFIKMLRHMPMCVCEMKISAKNKESL